VSLAVEIGVRWRREWEGMEITYLVFVAENGRVAKGVEFLLGLTHERIEPRFHVREFIPNMGHEDLPPTKQPYHSFHRDNAPDSNSSPDTAFHSYVQYSYTQDGP
jgi:hypothetical protein